MIDKGVRVVRTKQKNNHGKIKCPCCGYYTLINPQSEFKSCMETCGICWWKDNEKQLENPFLTNGVNRVSLDMARENFELYLNCKGEKGVSNN